MGTFRVPRRTKTAVRCQSAYDVGAERIERQIGLERSAPRRALPPSASSRISSGTSRARLLIDEARMVTA